MTEWVRVYGDPDNRPLQDALWFFERWLPGFPALRKWSAAMRAAAGWRGPAAWAVATATALYLTFPKGPGRASRPSGAFGMNTAAQFSDAPRPVVQKRSECAPRG